MKPSPISSDSPIFLPDGPPAVRMVMIYEDGESGRRAKRFADEVLHNTDEDCDGATNFWSFDVLGHKDVRNAAASAAAGADLMIFAASGDRELSPEVEEWLEMWAWLIGEKNPALVALLEKADGKSVRTIRANLRAIAERKALEFVAFHVPAVSEPGGVEREALASAERGGANRTATAL